MKIFEEYIDYDRAVIKAADAKYIGDFAIRIVFTDGTQKLVDFKPFLQKSNHPSIKKYLKEEMFKDYNIVNGNLNWNDYDLIFPIEDIYKGTI